MNMKKKNPSKINITINNGNINDNNKLNFKLIALFPLYFKLVNFTNVTKAKIINKAAIISLNILQLK